jgi:hypothetical protein
MRCVTCHIENMGRHFTHPPRLNHPYQSPSLIRIERSRMSIGWTKPATQTTPARKPSSLRHPSTTTHLRERERERERAEREHDGNLVKMEGDAPKHTTAVGVVIATLACTRARPHRRNWEAACRDRGKRWGSDVLFPDLQRPIWSRPPTGGSGDSDKVGHVTLRVRVLTWCTLSLEAWRRGTTLATDLHGHGWTIARAWMS